MQTLKTFYLRFFLGFILLVLNLSCQKSDQQPVSAKLFTIQDNSYTLYLPTSTGYLHFFQWPDNNILLDHTSDIFLFAEGLIQLGQTIPFDEEASHTLTRLGHLILSNFYDGHLNYTSYPPARSPYIQSILAITEVDNEGLLFQGLAEDINNALPALVNILNQMPLLRLEPIADMANYNLSSYFEHLRNYFLDHISNAVLDNPNISDNLGLIITRDIETYMQAVHSLQVALEMALDIEIDSNTTPNYNQVLTDVESAYDQFFGYFVYGDNQEVPQMHNTIANYIADESDRLNTLSTKLLPIGERLSANLAFQSNAKATLHQAASDNLERKADQEPWWGGFTQENWYGLPSFGKMGVYAASYFLQASAFTYRFTSDHITQPISDLTQQSRDSLNSSLLIEHANLLNNYLPDIARIIAATLYYKLESQITRNSAYDIIHHVIERDLQASIFKDQSILPGIELSNVTMQREGNSITFFRRDGENRDDVPTNGVTLGTAMSVLTERLQRPDTFEDILEDKNQLLFSLLNKSVVMLGYKTLEKSDNDMYELVYPTSFFRPIFGELQDESLDLWNYLSGHSTLSAQHTTPIDCPPLIHTRQESIQRGYFAIPDQIVLHQYEDTFGDIDLEQQDTMVATVRSQAELIRGASKILKYLSYDPQILGDMGLIEYDGVPLFPFSHVFQLPLAIATLNLHNLFRRGAVFYDDPQGPFSTELPENFVWSAVYDVIEEDSLYLNPLPSDLQDIEDENLSEDITIDPSLQEDIINENSTAYVVKTADLARLILAIEEFISMAQDLDDLQNLSDLSCMDRENHHLAQNSIELFSDFNNSLGAFLMAKLQKEDGSFVDHYTILQDTQSSTRSLESQIQAMHALIALYERVENEQIRTSVFQAFNYTMTHLLNNGSESFYIVAEGSDEKPNIRLTTDVFRLLYRMDVLLENDIYLRNELRSLRRRWTRLYVEDIMHLEIALTL